MATNIRTDIQTVLAGGTYDARPPAGTEWDVFDFGASLWIGGPPITLPEINVGIFDGIIGPAWLLRSTDTRGWYRDRALKINNANWLRIVNANVGAPNNVSFVAQLTRSFGASPTSAIITDLQAVLAGANWDVQPPVGQEYVLEDVGSDRWAGAPPLGVPDVNISIFDGAIAACLANGANAAGWDNNFNIYMNRNNYVRLTNTNALAAVIGISGKLSRAFGSGATVVRTDVQAVLAGANWDVRPPAGEEWEVTEIGAGTPVTWLGVPPAALPNVTVSIFDGAVASVIATSTDIKFWLAHRKRIFIDNTNYLRINDASGAGQNIAVSAVLTRQYS